MYRRKDPQRSLFEASMLLPAEKLERLKVSWAWQFRTKALPLIDEDAFRELYHEWNGRPNKPVQTVVGVLLLKEMEDLTDEGALGALEYDLRWQAALSLEPHEAHCCQKTLHNFRAKLMQSDKAKLLFEEMTAKIIEALGVKTERQRLDSTHIMSNIAVLTRLGLFCETARVFLKELRRESKEKFDSVPAGLRSRYLKDDGKDSSYDDARSSKARRRLSVCARDVWRLVDRFRGDGAIEKLESYGLLKRLLEEQCELKADAPPPASDDADAHEAPAPVAVKDAKGVKSDSLQTPHDAGVSYSGHKGKGYEVQVAETCGNEETPEMITYAEVTRSCDSDEHATVPAVEELASREIQPKELLADTNYGSTENAMKCEEKGTELVAPVPGPEVADGKITKHAFDVDPKGERKARCPRGHEATEEKRDEGTGRVRAFFDGHGCEGCPHRETCPAKPLRDGRRVLRTTVHGAVVARRRRYGKTKEFRKRYAERAGIEATNSELKRAHGLGHLRVRGILRVKLRVYLKALSCNVKRMVRCLSARARKAQAAVCAATEAAGDAIASSLRAILARMNAVLRQASPLARITGFLALGRSAVAA